MWPAGASKRCSIAPTRRSPSRPAANPIRECSSPSPSASTSRSTGRPAWATACATSRPQPRLEPIRSWCSPAKARKRALPDSFRKGPPSIRIWPRWRTRCANDLSALARLPDRRDPRHPALRDRRARHFSLAAAGTLSRHLRVVARHDLAGEKRARYPLPSDRHGEPAADSRRDPGKASIGLGDLGLPAHFPTAGAGIEARAPVDSLLRLGSCAYEPDRHRPQPRRPSAESDGRARPRAARSRVLDRNLPGRHARETGRTRQVSRRRRMACGEMRRVGRAGRPQRRPVLGSQRLSQASGNGDGGGRTADRFARSHAGIAEPVGRGVDRGPHGESMSPALSQLQLTGGILGYRLVRAKRRTIALFVDGDGIEARAPRGAAIADIEAFIREKERWIRRRLAEPRRRPLVWEPGATLPWLGRTVSLALRHGETGVWFSEDRLELGLADGASPRERALDWMRGQALEFFPERVAELAHPHGLRGLLVGLSHA